MALQLTESLAANQAATQVINQLNAIATQVGGALASGIPARGNVPAISAADLQAALGSVNLAKVQAVIAALS
jgi:hypothetical protein